MSLNQETQTLLSHQTDPISGNAIPPGATAKGVRDDVPARLSEGEWVLPQRIVELWGKDNIKRAQQEGESFLNQMASNPSNAVDAVNTTDSKYAEGGYVTPDVLKPSNQYKQTTVSQYVNPDTGKTMLVTFFDGQPLFNIPEGFVEGTVPDATPTPTTPTPEPAPAPAAAPEGIVGPIDDDDGGDDGGNSDDPFDDYVGEDSVFGAEADAKFGNFLDGKFTKGIGKVSDIYDNITGIPDAIGDAYNSVYGDQAAYDAWSKGEIEQPNYNSLDEVIGYETNIPGQEYSMVDNAVEAGKSALSGAYDKAKDKVTSAVDKALETAGLTAPSNPTLASNSQVQNALEAGGFLTGVPGIYGAISGVNNVANSKYTEKMTGALDEIPGMENQLGIWDSIQSFFGNDVATNTLGDLTPDNYEGTTAAITGHENYLSEAFTDQFSPEAIAQSAIADWDDMVDPTKADRDAFMDQFAADPMTRSDNLLGKIGNAQPTAASAARAQARRDKVASIVGPAIGAGASPSVGGEWGGGWSENADGSFTEPDGTINSGYGRISGEREVPYGKGGLRGAGFPSTPAVGSGGDVASGPNSGSLWGGSIEDRQDALGGGGGVPGGPDPTDPASYGGDDDEQSGSGGNGSGDGGTGSSGDGTEDPNDGGYW
jgi:hypothetical protein